jgi:hypothetical protein
VPDLRWIAVLLDKVPPQAREADAREAAVLRAAPVTPAATESP